MIAAARPQPQTRSGLLTTLLVLEWGLLAVALAAVSLNEVYRPYLPWTLPVLGLVFFLRAFRARRLGSRSGLDLAALLFTLSAGIAAAIAYQPGPAFLQLARILAGVVLFYSIIDSPPLLRRWVAVLFVLAAAALAVYYPLQPDFSPIPGKFPALAQLALWINAHAPQLPGPTMHSNVAGGVLALSAPFAFLLAWEALSRRAWLRFACFALALAAILFGLLLSGSRGAWLGLGAAAAFGVLAWVQRRWFSTPRSKWIYWGLLFSAGLSILALLLTGLAPTGLLERLLGGVLDPSGAVVNRWTLWRQGVSLGRDYLFTGSGLRSIRMVYAIYGILIHTPFHEHLHNTFLEVWIEQGLLGALALVNGSLVTLWWAWEALDRRDLPLLSAAGLASALVFTVHGMFDAVFYVTRPLPLVGLVLGLALAGLLAPPAGELAAPDAPQKRRSSFARALTIGFIMVLIVQGAVFARPLRAAWYANLGAVIQSYIELSHYDPAQFETLSIDQLRRTGDLSPAEAYYRKALDLDPANRTALQRLASLHLSRGEYEPALDLARRAWETGYRDEATRLLWGDALVAHGRPQEAAEVVAGLPWAENRLMGQAWYRYWRGPSPDPRRAYDACTAVLLLNPGNYSALALREQAAAVLERRP